MGNTDIGLLSTDPPPPQLDPFLLRRIPSVRKPSAPRSELYPGAPAQIPRAGWPLPCPCPIITDELVIVQVQIRSLSRRAFRSVPGSYASASSSSRHGTPTPGWRFLFTV